MRKQTFEEQLEPIKAKLYRYAYCYVKNEQDAQEILYDTIYKAYVSYSKMKKSQFFETWITRILMNTASDYLKKSKRIVPYDEIPEQMIIEPSISKEETWDLYDALDMLREDQRSLIVLKFFEEKSFREISEILQVPESTVKSRIYRILQELRERLERRSD